MTRLAARFSSPTISPDVGRPLNDSEMMQYAPSIFAKQAHHSRSERYAYIPTIDILNGLRDNGYQPFKVGQSKTRIADKREFTRHLIRMRHVDMFSDGEMTQEIILLNSHDGTSSYQLIHGVFRFVCFNGMVCGDVNEEIRVHHKGNVQEEVIAAARGIVNETESRQMVIEDMHHRRLNRAQQEAFAQAAIEIRFGEDNASVITSAQALEERRQEDRGASQWNVFNRVQENLTHGGMLGRNKSNKERRVRPITGLDKDTQFNRSLWRMMQALRGEVA
jgi:hypothetical protein